MEGHRPDEQRFFSIQYQGKSNSAGHQMDRGRRKQRDTHPVVGPVAASSGVETTPSPTKPL